MFARRVCISLVAVLAASAFDCGTAIGGGIDPPNGHATLWQIPLRYHGSSYVVKSPSGRVIVYDGGSDSGGSGIYGGYGRPHDVNYLKSFLNSLGGHVDAWFISHPHSDHVSVLTDFLESPDLQGLTIDKIYAQLPSEPWLELHEPVNMLPTTREFKSALLASGKSLIEPAIGDEIVIDGLKFKILSEIDESNHITDPNDYSMVIKLTAPTTSVMFLGDLGSEGGKLLLNGPYGGDLQADFVQVAHHGSWGVDKNVYEAIAPKYALFPAQSWLYDAPANHYANYTSHITRQWMQELGVLASYSMKDGLVEFDLGGQVPEPSASVLLILGLPLVCRRRR